MILSHKIPTGSVLMVTLLAAAVLLSGCVGQRRVSDKDIDLLTLESVRGLYDAQRRDTSKPKLLLIDARTPEEYARGHIPGAENIRLNDINPDLRRDSRIESFDDIVVYGNNPGSNAARGLVKRMLRMRYDDVYLFPGGYEQWTRAQLENETHSP